MAITIAVAVAVLVPDALHGNIFGLGLLMILVSIIIIAALPLSPSPRQALLAAVRALTDGEDPGSVLEGLRGVDVPEGRARMCLGVARRCLHRASRCRWVEWRMRREAAGWLRETIREMR
jgi:hypothetical protein